MANITEKEVLNGILDDLGVLNNRGISTWIVTATGDNAIATATKAAEAGKSHYVVAISATYNDSTINNLVALKDGANTVGNFHVGNIVFSKPLKLTAGNAVSVSLPASGTLGKVGAVTIVGFTI